MRLGWMHTLTAVWESERYENEVGLDAHINFPAQWTAVRCVPLLLNLTARSKGESPALLGTSTPQSCCKSLLMVNVLPGTQCWQA